MNNQFLKYCDVKNKQNRSLYWDDNTCFSIRENLDDSFVGLWFQTMGCTHDRNGGCTMCDYSAGPETDSDTMVQAVEKALKNIANQYETLLISPSGSMLDAREVPDVARKKIFQMIKDTNHASFTFETRADTISQETIRDSLDILGSRLKKIYMGVETTSDFINKYCINKGVRMEQIKNAAKLLNDNSITPIGNILVGIPILTQRESYIIAKQSVEWCMSNQVVPALFITHVKDNTLYNCMYQLGLCEEPSLWLLIQLILDLPDDLYMEICWYRTYEAFNLIKAAGTCLNCYEKVLEALDIYSKYKDKEVIRKLDCDCRKNWEESLEIEKPVLTERIVKVYHALADNLLDKDYWSQNGNEIEAMIYKEYQKEVFEW